MISFHRNCEQRLFFYSVFHSLIRHQQHPRRVRGAITMKSAPVTSWLGYFCFFFLISLTSDVLRKFDCENVLPEPEPTRQFRVQLVGPGQLSQCENYCSYFTYGHRHAQTCTWYGYAGCLERDAKSRQYIRMTWLEFRFVFEQIKILSRFRDNYLCSRATSKRRRAHFRNDNDGARSS